MAKVFKDHVWAAIDVGTTKICVLVGHQREDYAVEIVGIGRSPSDGLSKGVVVDIAKTIASIRTALREAELMAGCKIETAHVGISGAHIGSLNSQGVVPIKRGEVRASDIVSVIEAAKAVPIAEGQQILHVLPQLFIIDGHERVRDPLGMFGVRLEAQVHIITGAVSSVQNLIKCCEHAGVAVTDIVLEQLASARAVLTTDERELGVAVLDIGGGTADLALYQHGNIRHTRVIPVAGNHFTNDIAIGLHTTIAEAERIKQEYGIADLLQYPLNTAIDVGTIHGQGTRPIPLHMLSEIVHARAFELLSIVNQEIATRRLKPLIPAGMVLTGGGSLLNGIIDVATDIFDIPVRIGTPSIPYDDFAESLASPIYATGYGLLLHACQKNSDIMQSANSPMFARIFSRMKSFVSDFF